MNEARIRLLHSPDGPDDETEFEAFREAEIRDVHSDEVRQLTLRGLPRWHPLAGMSPDDSMLWLREHLLVDFPGDADVMRVRVTGGLAKETCESLMRALVHAYITRNRGHACPGGIDVDVAQKQIAETLAATETALDACADDERRAELLAIREERQRWLHDVTQYARWQRRTARLQLVALAGEPVR
ncbi:MAG: hypothetical protein HYX69_01930 [Planctomycetia bacterium]|nr:hypothetical protein [Planctomycetia bacterium]